MEGIWEEIQREPLVALWLAAQALGFLVLALLLATA